MANFSVGDFFSDALRGMGEGLSNYNPNNPFSGMGAAIKGSMARSEQERISDLDYKNWLRKYETTAEDRNMESIAARAFSKSEREASQDFQSKQRDYDVDRALSQLQESLEMQRLARKKERSDIKSERGGFKPFDIDQLLFDSVGQFSPRYTGTPSRSSTPQMAWGGGSIS